MPHTAWKIDLSINRIIMYVRIVYASDGEGYLSWMKPRRQENKMNEKCKKDHRI